MELSTTNGHIHIDYLFIYLVAPLVVLWWCIHNIAGTQSTHLGANGEDTMLFSVCVILCGRTLSGEHMCRLCTNVWSMQQTFVGRSTRCVCVYPA